jgi:hypothetical protein
VTKEVLMQIDDGISIQPPNKKFAAAILEQKKLLLAKPTHREVRK